MELPKNKLLNIYTQLLPNHNQRHNRQIISLFKINTQHHKPRKSLTYSLGIFNIELIDKGVPFMFHHVAQPETKFQLGYQFEKRQINIAPYSHFEIRVISIEAQQVVSFFRDVDRRSHPQRQIRTIIIQPFGTVFDTHRHHDISRFQIDRAPCIAMILSQFHRFITEQQGRGKTKIEIRTNIKVANQADIETGRERGYFGNPCLSDSG